LLGGRRGDHNEDDLDEDGIVLLTEEEEARARRAQSAAARKAVDLTEGEDMGVMKTLLVAGVKPEAEKQRRLKEQRVLETDSDSDESEAEDKPNAGATCKVVITVSCFLVMRDLCDLELDGLDLSSSTGHHSWREDYH